MKCQKTKVKKQRGITLIASIITIVILIILATISFNAIFGDNGIIGRAQTSKMITLVQSVKEEINMYSIEKMISNTKVTPESLLVEGKVSRIIKSEDDGKYHMYYYLNENSFNAMMGMGKGSVEDLKDIFLIDESLNVKYISSKGKQYGDQIEDKILDDETKINFSSKAFSEYVSKISGVPEENMQFKWMKNQTVLYLEDSDINSLQDLVFFPNLTFLTIGSSDGKAEKTPDISSLDGIECCTKLERLIIQYGKDKDYTAIRKLENLREFQRNSGTDYNNIMENLKYCSNLKSLSISRTKTTLDMKKIEELPELTYINLSSNNIEKIEGLSKQTSLEELYLSNNKIQKIENLSNLENLKKLDLSINNIVDITPLSANKNLKELYLTGNSTIDGDRSNYTGEKLIALNQLGELLDNGGNIYLDIDKLGLFTNYKKLNFKNAGLNTLDALEGIEDLTELSLEGNNLTLKDENSQNILGKMKKLENLNLINNKLESISAVNNLTNLKKLSMNGNENLKEIEDIISNIEILQISNATLQTIVNCDSQKIKSICLQGRYITELPDFSKFNNLSKFTFDASLSKVTNYDVISNISSLTDLQITNANLHGKMIDLTKFTHLTNLNLSKNSLWSEDLLKLLVLKDNDNLVIDLRNNSIIDASILLQFKSNTKIYLKGNVNLTQDSKDKLKEKFGNNVTF